MLEHVVRNEHPADYLATIEVYVRIEIVKEIFHDDAIIHKDVGVMTSRTGWASVDQVRVPPALV
jgi:hypothetical protein